jgi:hypothetical protein
MRNGRRADRWPARLTVRAGGELLSALTYQEMLRTLGTLLDEAGCPTANLRLCPQGAEVIAAGWNECRVWTARDLRDAAARQRRRRSAGSATTFPRQGWRTSLRALGAHLDTLRGGSYVLTVQPDAVRVQGTSGYDQTFPTVVLGRRARLLPYLRDQPSRAG